jgi:undecaprenyl-diphosphatase
VDADPVLKRNRGLLWLLVIGTIPAAIVGFLFQKQAETTLRTPYVIAATMIGIGIVLWLAERAGHRQKDLSHVNFMDSLSIGASQALAVIPGVSRSGITIAAGLFRNLDRESAGRFSFLLSTPVIAGAAAKDMWDLMRHEGGIPPEMRSAFLIGIAISAVVGGLTIKFFLSYLKRSGLTVFVLYRIVFGIIVIALAHFFRYSGG